MSVKPDADDPSLEANMLAAMALDDALQEKQEHYASGASQLDDAPPAVATAKTDADGKFIMRLPRKGNFGLVARGQREVAGKKELYHWIEWVSLDGKASKHVMLSNDNLIERVYPTERIYPPR